MMYHLGNDEVDSIELKCLVVSRGVKVDKAVYQKYCKETRLSQSPLMCNCMILSDNTIVQLTDMSFHLRQLGSMLSWNMGPGKAFSNFIIGIEPFESLKEGAAYLAKRGIIPTVSIWMPMGRPVMGTMQAPELDFYRKVKDLFAELYQKYNLEPAGCCGLNVCMERDIWRYSMSR